MRVLFLFAAFLPMILAVHAQRSFSQYVCQLSTKDGETAFYLSQGETREVEVGGWKIRAGLSRVENELKLSLLREIIVMDASYRREAHREYPLNARVLGVTLEHSFGGTTDVFTMLCRPRDP